MTKRRPEIPQRQMVDEVRVTVDRWCGDPVCHHGRCIMARATLRQLARDNPHNFWSHKVIYNIGLERLTRVLTTVTGPLPEEAFARVRERLLSKSMRRSRSVSLDGPVVVHVPDFGQQLSTRSFPFRQTEGGPKPRRRREE